MYYFPIFLTIIANVAYQILQKNTPEKINPFFSIIITYSVGLVLSVILFFVLNGEKSIEKNLNALNWSPALLGCAIVLLELGFLLSYRAGWNVSTAAIFSTIAVSIILVPIGIIFFRETISIKNIIGILLSVIGVVLISLK